MISRHFPARAPRFKVLSRSARPLTLRTWAQRFWNHEELFELKATLLVAMTLIGAWVGA